jgi:hypothetical protein
MVLAATLVEAKIDGPAPVGSEMKSRVSARVTEFGYPPVHDALVLGVHAPLGTEAFKGALGLLVSVPFEHVTVEDDVIGSLLVRTSVLRRVSREKFLDFVLRRVKPLMGAEEILHLDVTVEVELDDDAR